MASQNPALPEQRRRFYWLLAQVPDHAKAHHLLGLVCSRQGRQTEAVEHLQRAIALDP